MILTPISSPHEEIPLPVGAAFPIIQIEAPTAAGTAAAPPTCPHFSCLAKTCADSPAEP